MSTDDAKSKILARRASFVAAALAGVACSKEPADKPQVCLSPPVVHTNADAAPPTPCLSVPIMPVEAPDASDASQDAGAVKDAGVAKARPKPLPPPPRPCLSVRPTNSPKDQEP